MFFQVFNRFFRAFLFLQFPKKFHHSHSSCPTPNSKPSRTPFWVLLDSVTYTKLLQSATESRSLIEGKITHAHMIKTSFKPCLFLQNNLLNMYCKCGDINNARQLFDRMPKRNIISLNSIISSYSQMGFYDKSMEVFIEARATKMVLDRFTYASALSVCARNGDLRLGLIVHGLVVVSGLGSQVFLTNSLIDMYAKCGRMDQARLLFDNSDELDDVSWNSLVAGYVRISSNEEALEVFVQMHRFGVKMNSFAFGSVIKACSGVDGLQEFGKMIHGCVIKAGLDSDVFVGSAMLDMYAKSRRLDNAILVFKLMSNPNVVVFNAMIAGFFRSETEICDEFANEALSLFSEMRKRGLKPSKFTFSSIVRACNSIGALEHGKQIHAQIFKNSLQSDEFIGSALIDLYSKSGLTEDGLKCFNSIPKHDIVSWTSMIAGCVQNGQFEQALSLFYELLIAGRKPDQFTISSVLSACANLAVARVGEQIQGYATKSGFSCFTIVRNSQICMYAKSGDIDAADQTFDDTENRDVVSWSVIISSHAQHGCAREALRLFEDMKVCQVEPNHITFLGALTACSHGGLLDEGFRYFESMKKDYSMIPNLKHCACIVDLLGRAGKLADAEHFIVSSGFEDDPVMWRALLGACRIHGDTDIAERVAERVIELEPQAAASYVLLYNIYLDAGKRSSATKVRDLMKGRGIKKEPGLSWIQIGTDVHSFVVGDKSHPQGRIIYEKLEEMLEKVKGMGYPDNDSSIFDESNKEHRENSANYHSEKLAVVLGMIGLPESAPIRVMKNLRVCIDCHTTMKFFSKIEKREIILRDPIRFHRFREGSCSCGDYW
ncbi:pentatricopeptide repeat-containing protein At3g13880 [Magnolia sinica]|uniref:pentatricopeptide repeat-containing protein At3g13880 n=1 Tax=Magnolia sinica TaxID=86752 RepID=UPI00265B5EE1|nr:pentatricopeptide repeat-containing protein At3g13880 [Magnolia sinica]